jgi:hypothetical protein
MIDDDDDDDDSGALDSLNDWQGKPTNSEKTCSNVALSTTNPI